MENNERSEQLSNSLREQPDATPADHISGAQGSLKVLREKVGEHPELEDALTRLEMALSILTVNTGGML